MREAHPDHFFADRIKVEPGQIVITSAQGFPLWHLPLAEAEGMTAGELRGEMRHAAGEYGVKSKDLWAALRTVRRQR